MYTVTKSIDFCYGHRLLRYKGRCSQLHGHNARAEIVVARDYLDPQGFVEDFSIIKDTMKTWIDTHLDHKFLLHWEDPLIQLLSEEPCHKDLVPLQDNPTAETIAEIIYKEAEKHFPIVSVKLWETPDSFAVYTR